MTEFLCKKSPKGFKPFVLEYKNWKVTAWNEGEVVDTGFKGFGLKENYKKITITSRHVKIEKHDEDGNVIFSENFKPEIWNKFWLLDVLKYCAVEGVDSLIENYTYIEEIKGVNYKCYEIRVFEKTYNITKKQIISKKQTISKKQKRYSTHNIREEYYEVAYPLSKLSPESMFESLGLDPYKEYTKKQIMEAANNVSPWGIVHILSTWESVFLRT